MILHSIKSIIRTPKKTILFFFLITLLSILLSIGTGMHQSVYKMLKEADSTFSTVVELNYLGDKGNNEQAFYEDMNKKLTDFDFKKLESHPDVISVNKENSALAYIEGDVINQKLSDLSNQVIIEVFNVHKHDEMYYRATINQVFFGKNIKENTYVFIKVLNDDGTNLGFDLVSGHKYLIVGRKSRGKNPTPIITPGLPEGVEGFDIVVDLKENPEYYDSESGANILRFKDTLSIVTNSLPVTMVTSLEACEPYFNRDILIKEGRIFKEEEYQEGNNQVIMISKTLADFYKVKLGDKLNMSLHYARSGLGLSDYIRSRTFSNVADYEIVGIFEDKYESKLQIYMPKADWIEQDYHSVTLARYLVRNSSADRYIEDNKKDLLINMTFTKYDQGYEEAIKPIRELMDIAVLLLVLGAISGIIILLLFAYLYVYKQRDTLINMINLGTGKRRTVSYIIFASLLMLVLASTLGSFSSFAFINKLTNDLYSKMRILRSSDMRYSERAIGIQMRYLAEADVSKWLPLVTVLFILILGLILLYGFTVYILNEKSLINNKIIPIKAKKTKNL